MESSTIRQRNVPRKFIGWCSLSIKNFFAVVFLVTINADDKALFQLDLNKPTRLLVCDA
jgi:hypothetical protein